MAHRARMERTARVSLSLIAMVVLIVVVDATLLRHDFWPRLGVNVAIVAIVIAVYAALVRHR